uniref:Uncharacterized protein n=2 Tax=Oryzias latipes TaxID=8090 RepID=A0A3P9MEI3_ORYLA
MSGSISRILPEMGAALFRSPTSSSNSEANTEEGKYPPSRFDETAATSSDWPDGSFRCCR